MQGPVHVSSRFALDYHRPFGILHVLCSDMLDPTAPFRPEEIESQAVVLGLDLCYKLGSKLSPLRWVEEAFENRALYALTEILAYLSHFAKALLAMVRLRYIVTHDDHHLSLPEKSRITVEVAADVPRQQQCLGMHRDPEMHLLADKRMR